MCTFRTCRLTAAVANLVEDYCSQGDEVWKWLNRGPKQQLWYYTPIF
jgi:hypothetical protein